MGEHNCVCRATHRLNVYCTVSIYVPQHNDDLRIRELSIGQLDITILHDGGGVRHNVPQCSIASSLSTVNML